MLSRSGYGCYDGRGVGVRERERVGKGVGVGVGVGVGKGVQVCNSAWDVSVLL